MASAASKQAWEAWASFHLNSFDCFLLRPPPSPAHSCLLDSTPYKMKRTNKQDFLWGNFYGWIQVKYNFSEQSSEIGLAIWG